MGKNNLRNNMYVLVFFVLWILPGALFAEITINIEYPGVNIADIEEFETLVDEYFNDYISGIEENVEKERMMQAFSEANAFNISVITHPGAYTFKTLSFSLSLSVGSQLFSLDYDEFVTTMNDLEFEEDLYFGVGLQPFTCSLLFFPEGIFPFMKKYVSGLIMGINIGGSRLLYYDFPLNSFNIGISALYSLFPGKKLGGLITWDPLRVNTSISFFYNSIVIPLEYDLQIPLTIDPDDSGPLDAITGNAVISMSPEISLRSETFVIPISLVTSLNVGWLFLLDLGCGLDIFLGRGYIAIEDKADISLDGDLAGYLESNGTLTLVGQMYENHPDLLRFKISASLGFNFDPVWIKIPLVYYFNNGLSAGIKIGLSY